MWLLKKKRKKTTTYFLAIIATTTPNTRQCGGMSQNKPYLHQKRVSGEEMSHWDIIWHPLQCWIQSHYNWKGRRKFVRKRTHEGSTRTHCVNLLPWWRRYKFVFVLKGLFIHELYINSPFPKSHRHWQCAALSDMSYRNWYPGYCLYSLIHLVDVKLYVRLIVFGQTFTLFLYNFIGPWRQLALERLVPSIIVNQRFKWFTLKTYMFTAEKQQLPHENSSKACLSRMRNHLNVDNIYSDSAFMTDPLDPTPSYAASALNVWVWKTSSKHRREGKERKCWL